jgi:hypothetical protein
VCKPIIGKRDFGRHITEFQGRQCVVIQWRIEHFPENNGPIRDGWKHVDMAQFPVHDELDVQNGETIFKSDDWWKAIVLYEGYRGMEGAIYLWQANDGDWNRSQKYVIRSEDDWEQDKEAIERFIGAL